MATGPSANSLDRFVAAQAEGVYRRALGELQAGAKRSHWMWFIFPQLAGLGRSAAAQFYAIRNLAEARDYLDHEVLGPRLVQCTEAMLSWHGQRSAEAVLGQVDAMKFRSSMTLFDAAAQDAHIFQSAIAAFYDGAADPATMERL